ncbi:MAG: phosphoenolpyruvate--protein phosphotransferase, partial [Candidatus Zixiibacteriota bacterium]
MEIKKGIAVSPGVVIRPAVVLDAEEYHIPERHISPDRVDDELKRFEKALSQSTQELNELRSTTAKQLGNETAAIFDFHLALLKDKNL